MVGSAYPHARGALVAAASMSPKLAGRFLYRARVPATCHAHGLSRRATLLGGAPRSDECRAWWHDCPGPDIAKLSNDTLTVL